ncbi:MAG: hypothetical protein EOP39_03575 [Rubrivivax sp.]|nr:MAG: hypothetical protein EOP39_03575 [Rubrivivax sp.]
MFRCFSVAGLLFLACLCADAAPLVVTLRQPASVSDARLTYPHAFIVLALEKTVASHGPYTIQYSPRMNDQRARLSVEQSLYPGFLTVIVPRSDDNSDTLVPVRFPLHLGIAGYRVCFVSPKAQAAVAKVRTLDQLRRFTIAQGVGWMDVPILRANGFQVEEVTDYEAMFKMVAQSRFDLFCRSVVEVGMEAEAHRNLPGLLLDKTLALAYDLPQFFYTHRNNRELADRVTRGLEMAYADGSLLTLFRAHMSESLRFAEIPKRRVFRLSTPPPKGINFNYRRYDLDLTRELK